MSGIPPAVASIIQGHAAQARAERSRATEANSEARRHDKSTFADRLNEVIESDELDVQVHSEAEGQGSQGRTSSEEEAESDAPLDSPDDSANDDDTSIDLSA